ncbi:hypothetical protein [Streptomyces sp. NPDC021224]|uniref:hypothetical protein n=1 Tax=unclassified Streptomyces TaxID=2593676 RepID=UPI00378C7D49
MTARPAAAAVLGALAVPAVLTDLAHGASADGGYDDGAAWHSLYDGSNSGRLLGLEVTLVLAGAAVPWPRRGRTPGPPRSRGRTRRTPRRLPPDSGIPPGGRRLEAA